METLFILLLPQDSQDYYHIPFVVSLRDFEMISVAHLRWFHWKPYSHNIPSTIRPPLLYRSPPRYVGADASIRADQEPLRGRVLGLFPPGHCLLRPFSWRHLRTALLVSCGRALDFFASVFSVIDSWCFFLLLWHLPNHINNNRRFSVVDSWCFFFYHISNNNRRLSVVDNWCFFSSSY